MAVAMQPLPITVRILSAQGILPFRPIELLAKPCNDFLLFRSYLSLFRLLMEGCRSRHH